MRDYYECLEVSSSASASEIKNAYKTLVAKYHPDRYRGHPLEKLAAQRLAELNEAYAVLSDKARRRNYDAVRQGRRNHQGDSSGARATPAQIEEWLQQFSRVAGAVLLLFLVIRYGIGLAKVLVGVAAAGRGLGAIALLGIGFFLYWLYKQRRQR